MTTTKDLMSAHSRRLRNMDPDIWNQFVAVFDAYSTEVTVAVTSAPQDQILNAQGRAQQCLALLRMFRECDKEPQPPSA